MSKIPRDATAAERRLYSDRVLLEWIADRQEEQMAAIDDLRANIADLESAQTAENTELGAIVSALQSAEATITQLQTQVASGGGVTEADLEALAQTVANVSQAAKDATSSASTATGTDTTAGGGTAVPAGGGAPAGTTTAPTPAGTTAGGTAPAERTVYTFDGDPTQADAAVWPTAPVLTTDTPPRTLYFFSGDSQNADGSWTTSGDGVGGVWHVYSGATQPVPQAAEAPAEVTPGEGAPDPTLAAGAGASAGSELTPGAAAAQTGATGAVEAGGQAGAEQ